MVAEQVIWHGTKQEADDLLCALDRNCTCEFDGETNMKTFLCPGHKMMLHDQKAVDGLVFERHIVACLRREEGLTEEGTLAA